MGQLLLYSFLLLFGGALQFPQLTLSEPNPNYDSFKYEVDPPSKVLDPASGHIISYEFVSARNDAVSRVKRETISVSRLPEEDKSAFTKKPSSTKKPTTIVKSETINNSSISMSTSTSLAASPPSKPNSNNKTEGPGKGMLGGSPAIAAIGTPVLTPPSLPSSPVSSNSSSSAKPSNSTAGVPKTTSKTPNPTLTPPDSYPFFPEFPQDLPKNYTTKNDTHRYYNSSYFQNGDFLWVDLDNHPDSETHELLSNAHRRAATVRLEFSFPFYGHLVTNVTMATGGFIYLGEQVHAWLAATQYVAPLMANFDSRDDNTSSVRYLSNATQFTVEWNQVHLHNNSDVRPFTFQTSLYKNGTIVFAYKEIPIEVRQLNDTHHPVKVGLSDAYITDKTILFVKSRTIFEYDRVDLRDYKIVNGSGIVFTALPTCLNYNTCVDCTSHMTQFNCVWCPRANRCSDGTDRHRQDWIIKSCAFQSLDTRIACFIGTTSTENSDIYRNFGHDDHDGHDHEHDDNHLLSPAEEQYNHDHQTIYSPEKATQGGDSSGMSASGVMGLLFLLTLIFGVAGWLFYAYNYPHTPSGQLLIRFRPSQWSAFRRGEARYTAASIHM